MRFLCSPKMELRETLLKKVNGFFNRESEDFLKPEILDSVEVIKGINEDLEAFYLAIRKVTKERMTQCPKKDGRVDFKKLGELLKKQPNFESHKAKCSSKAFDFTRIMNARFSWKRIWSINQSPYTLFVTEGKVGMEGVADVVFRVCTEYHAANIK